MLTAEGAGNLLKPEQLRYWSDTSRQVTNMRHAQKLLWTREGRQHENLLTDAPPNEEDTDDGPNESEDESSASWEHDTCLVKRKTRPSSSGCLACPLGEARMSQQVYYNAREEHPRTPPKTSKTRITHSLHVLEEAWTVRSKLSARTESRGEEPPRSFDSWNKRSRMIYDNFCRPM